MNIFNRYNKIIYIIATCIGLSSCDDRDFAVAGLSAVTTAAAIGTVYATSKARSERRKALDYERSVVIIDQNELNSRRCRYLGPDKITRVVDRNSSNRSLISNLKSKVNVRGVNAIIIVSERNTPLYDKYDRYQASTRYDSYEYSHRSYDYYPREQYKRTIYVETYRCAL